MPHQFDQFQAQLAVVLRDAVGHIKSNERDVFILQAIQQRYSKDRPRELVADVPGNGTSLLALPSAGGVAFEEGFSVVKAVEFPVGSMPPTLLDGKDWDLYRAPSGLKIMLLSMAPGASDTLRITWTARHSADASTVPDADFEAVCDYAAALCYEALAGDYAQTGDPTILADTVNYRTKSQEYLGLAKAARRRYFNHVGISEDEIGRDGAIAAASISIGDTDFSLGSGVPRLTHGGRR